MSLAYHLADIYLEELDKALGRSEDVLPAPLSTLVHPFLTLAARTINKATYDRIQSALIEPLLSAFSHTPASSSDEDVDEDGERNRKRLRLSGSEYAHLVSNACIAESKVENATPPTAVRRALLKQIFDVAGQGTTKDANRRKLYGLWKRHTDEDDDSS